MKNFIKQLLFFFVFKQFTFCQDKKIQDISNMPIEHKNLPILSSPINDSIFIIEKVMDGNFSRIFFDNINQFYIIDNGGNDVVKLDKNGIKTFEMRLTEKGLNGLPDLMTIKYPSYFIVGCNGIYDLSKDKPSLEKFSSILNTENNFNEVEWKIKFNELYNNSEVVIFGFQHPNKYGKSPIYFRNETEWTLLYETGHEISTEGYLVKCEVDNKFVPEKYDKIYILKDAEKNIFSDGNKGVENPYKDKNDESSENKMDYKPRMKLTTTNFYKYRTDQENSKMLLGKSINNLCINEHNILFQEIAIKNTEDNSKICENFMYLFDIPTPFQVNNFVGLLFYQFPYSWSKKGVDYSAVLGKSEGINSGEIEGENAGVYVIRKK